MGCQRKIAEKIVSECEADYVLNVKGNQPALQEDIVQHFQNQEMQDKIKNLNIAYNLLHNNGKVLGENELSMVKTVEKGHGRIEVRKYYYSRDILLLSESLQKKQTFLSNRSTVNGLGVDFLLTTDY
jgi:predicted transposase YbfD/YdcC